MPTRGQVYAWIAAVGLLAPTGVSGQDRTEREVVELIVRDGPQARAIRTEAEVARRDQLARQAYPNPSFTYSRERAGFTEFYQAEQSLPLFGTRASLSRAGVAATAAAEADRDARLWILRSNAATAAARVVAAQELVASGEAHIREVERLVEILRTREREGEGSRFDRLRAGQELHESAQLLTSAAVALTEARTELAGMLPPGVSVSSVAAAQADQTSPFPIAGLITLAGASRAELRALQGLDERATFEGEAARRARLPSPTVFGGVKRADEGLGRETGGVFGLSVSVALFDRGERDAARWDAERARIEAERASIEERIRSEITGAMAVLAMRHTALGREPMNDADELVQIAVVAYREGEVGILELLDAMRTVARARTRAVNLRLELRLAQIALERAVGDTLWP